jgi:DNA-binding NarL/FixJ family response regulator
MVQVRSTNYLNRRSTGDVRFRLGKASVVSIFLVDDNAMIRSHLRAILERQHDWVVVGEAENGRRFLEGWSELSPNLTLMDFVMPDMDGLEAARQLRREHPEAQILMVTIDPSLQLAQEAEKVGIRGLVAKADLRSLFAAVEALLKGNKYFPLPAVA